MVNLLVTGDIVNYKNNDGKICSSEIEAIVKSSDYAICNFEAPIMGSGQPQLKSGPHHHQLKSTVKGLKDQGFNHLLLANNHIMDFGEVGLNATINEIKKNNLDFCGAGCSIDDAYKPFVKEINGLSIGIINAGEAQFGVLDDFMVRNGSGYAWINHHLIDQNIIKLKENCDFVLVFSHAGLENYSIPQKEWRNRYQHLCELGADAVIGSHPHVPQGYERHNESFIFYSLGNFYFDGGRWEGKESSSFALKLKLEKGKTMDFEPVFHYTCNNKVELAPDSKKININELCMLLNDEYQKKHEEMSLLAFKNIKRSLISSFFSFPLDSTLKGTIKEVAATLLGRRKRQIKHLTSLHLIRNEAYYYAMRHALELEARKHNKNV